jgi:ABC-type glycerol-3-phosphate transport system substrate-binding protein
MNKKSISSVFLWIILYLTNKIVHAQSEIYISVPQPEYPYTLPKDFEKKYSDLNWEYFQKIAKDNPILKDEDFVIKFLFFDYSWWEGSFALLEKSFVKFLGEEGFDFMVMDDRIFFDDLGIMSATYIPYYVDIDYPSLTLLMDYKDYINDEEMDFHDPKQYKEGKYDGHIYGLPFDIDFDGLYYYNNNEKAKSIVENISDKTWDDLVDELNSPPSAPLKVALNVDTDLLGFFVEYINNHRNFNKEYDSKFYDIFLNKTGDDLINNFYNLTQKYTDKKATRSTSLKRDQAFTAFTTENSTFLRGKASLYSILRDSLRVNDTEISFTLPPKKTTNLFHRYLVANKARVGKELSPKVFAEIAKILTSKEMQLFRAETFGGIPTFDLKKKDSDDQIKIYCDEFPMMCEYLETMNKIYIKEIFNPSKYAVPYFEVECFLPLKIRYYLESGKQEDFDVIKHVLYSIKYLVTNGEGFSWYIFFSIVCIIISLAISYGTIYFTNKFKDHPSIKIISPSFCNMIVFGSSMSLIKPLFRLPPYSYFKIRFVLIYNTINYGLIFIPMFVVTYRIFRIYKVKTFLSNSLTNKRLMIITIVLISLSTIYRMVIAFTSKVYYKMVGGIRESRMPYIYYSNNKIDSDIYFTYNNIIFIALIFMIICTGSFSKKFGDICYVFVVFLINVNDFMINFMITIFDEGVFFKFFFLLTIYNDIMVLFCIYFLVGSRVLNILINPKYDNVRGSSVDLRKYISLNFSLFTAKTLINSNKTNKNSTLRSNRESNTSTLKSNTVI